MPLTAQATHLARCPRPSTNRYGKDYAVLTVSEGISPHFITAGANVAPWRNEEFTTRLPNNSRPERMQSAESETPRRVIGLMPCGQLGLPLVIISGSAAVVASSLRKPRLYFPP